MRTCYVKIAGRVQKVGYRYSTTKMAQQLHIRGWVRNCEDGSVEAVFQGNPEDVEKILFWCHRGPSLALVQEVQVFPQENASLFTEFSVK